MHIFDRIFCTCMRLYIPPWWLTWRGQNRQEKHKWQMIIYYWWCSLLDQTLYNNNIKPSNALLTKTTLKAMFVSLLLQWVTPSTCSANTHTRLTASLGKSHALLYIAAYLRNLFINSAFWLYNLGLFILVHISRNVLTNLLYYVPTNSFHANFWCATHILFHVFMICLT